MQLEDYIQLYQPATIRKHAMEIETIEANLLRIDRVFHSGELYYNYIKSNKDVNDFYIYIPCAL